MSTGEGELEMTKKPVYPDLFEARELKKRRRLYGDVARVVVKPGSGLRCGSLEEAYDDVISVRCGLSADRQEILVWGELNLDLHLVKTGALARQGC